MNFPVPGAVSVVKELSGRFRLGVISNGSPDVQYRKLEAIGLGGIFACVLLSEEIGIRKPDPRIFHIAANALRGSSRMNVCTLAIPVATTSSARRPRG